MPVSHDSWPLTLKSGGVERRQMLLCITMSFDKVIPTDNTYLKPVIITWPIWKELVINLVMMEIIVSILEIEKQRCGSVCERDLPTPIKKIKSFPILISDVEIFDETPPIHFHFLGTTSNWKKTFKLFISWADLWSPRK